LRRAESSCVLFGSSIYDDSVAPAFCNEFVLAPPTSSPDYLEWLLSTIRRLDIDLLIPGIEIDMYHWAEHVSEIRATGAIPLLNNLELIELCKDKWGFYECLTAEGLNCAIDTSLETNFDVLVARFGLPFLLKPRRGFGSKGIVRVATAEVFSAHCAQIGPTLMVQPIVGTDENEFTTSAFCDGQGGFFAAMTLRRKLSPDGFTDKAEVVDTAEFAQVLDDLCRLFNPIGPTNFQFRRSAEGLKLLEINPRISSSTSIRAAFGYNESVMALDYFLGGRVPVQPEIRRGRAVRFTDEHIFYEDSVHF